MKILEQFTWSQFLLISLAAIAIYYMVVIIRFKIDLRKLFASSKPLLAHGHDGEDDGAHESDPEQPDTGNDIMVELEQLVDHIGYRILEAGNGKPKDELFKEIVESVSSFSGLHLPAYQYALNNYIIDSAKKSCGVTFSEEELEAAWEKLLRN